MNRNGYTTAGIAILPAVCCRVWPAVSAQAASDESEGELALGMQLRYDAEDMGEFPAGVETGLVDGIPDYSVVIGCFISF